MTFDEATYDKTNLPNNFIEDEIEMEIIVIPENTNDQSKYWQFIFTNYADFSDKDAVMFSTNKRFKLGAIGQDNVSGTFLFHNELPEKIRKGK